MADRHVSVTSAWGLPNRSTLTRKVSNVKLHPLSEIRGRLVKKRGTSVEHTVVVQHQDANALLRSRAQFHRSPRPRLTFLRRSFLPLLPISPKRHTVFLPTLLDLASTAKILDKESAIHDFARSALEVTGFDERGNSPSHAL